MSIFFLCFIINETREDHIAGMEERSSINEPCLVNFMPTVSRSFDLWGLFCFKAIITKIVFQTVSRIIKIAFNEYFLSSDCAEQGGPAKSVRSQQCYNKGTRKAFIPI